jgi:hypothetical protein
LRRVATARFIAFLHGRKHVEAEAHRSYRGHAMLQREVKRLIHFMKRPTSLQGPSAIYVLAVAY